MGRRGKPGQFQNKKGHVRTLSQNFTAGQDGSVQA